METASADLVEEKANLQKILSDNASQGFVYAEKRVADAQVAFLIADQVLTQATAHRIKKIYKTLPKTNMMQLKPNLPLLNPITIVY